MESRIEADQQVAQLEQALLQQAETLARAHLQNGESTRARILAESDDKLKRAAERETVAAKIEAERLFQRHLQAAETRLAAELDRLRWALTEAVLGEVKMAYRHRMQDDAPYFVLVEAWLAEAAIALPSGDLIVKVRPDDEARLQPRWQAMTSRAAPGRTVVLAAHGATSEGGLCIALADDRARVDQTYEARRERLADELARVIMERLFASASDLGTLTHG